ncbi:GNAT family N-acetyltransferase [Nonomuraea spiralis]|uniref:GNAT family N-acetyltransferase n=1 Tax=Nonomuraea spiralis TaxID=46182 RepID=A0ABV5IPE6_9ACTN|nr:GNAT family N-acetyltransferase [Nonomuraea spiralis]GGT26686.1 N-acetyltransferase [Nonomuraea spiralis]
MRIRQATSADAGAIAEVHVRSWQAAYRGLVPQDHLDGMNAAARRPAWERWLARTAWPREGTLVAEAVAALSRAGYRQAVLWVLDANVRARRFYEAAGWHDDGVVKDDDSRGFVLTEIRYRRPLD